MRGPRGCGTVCVVSDVTVANEIEVEETVDSPWVVLLWNDPVNTMEYVSKAVCRVFSYTAAQAERVMLAAHQAGKAPAWTGEREVAEQHCRALHGWGLQATLQKDGE